MLQRQRWDFFCLEAYDIQTCLCMVMSMYGIEQTQWRETADLVGYWVLGTGYWVAVIKISAREGNYLKAVHVEWSNVNSGA